MNSRKLESAVVFVLLLAAGVAGRFLFLDIPNFTPTAALALFAGFYFARTSVAIALPLAVMVVSNLWLPSYPSMLEQVVVFAAMLLPVALGRSLLRRPSPWRIAAAVFLPSFCFYLVTNFAVWLLSGMYSHTAAGLADCYVRALPFYRWMLEADLLFTAIAFGCYVAVRGATLEKMPALFVTMLSARMMTAFRSSRLRAGT